MKSRCENSVDCCTENFFRPCLLENDAINDLLAKTKQTLLREYSKRVDSDQRLLELVLQEAEALAWQTEYPHLVFPMLAVEKAQTAVAWHRRQSRIIRNREVAFAA